MYLCCEMMEAFLWLINGTDTVEIYEILQRGKPYVEIMVRWPYLVDSSGNFDGWP